MIELLRQVLPRMRLLITQTLTRHLIVVSQVISILMGKEISETNLRLQMKKPNFEIEMNKRLSN